LFGEFELPYSSLELVNEPLQAADAVLQRSHLASSM